MKKIVKFFWNNIERVTKGIIDSKAFDIVLYGFSASIVLFGTVGIWITFMVW